MVLQMHVFAGQNAFAGQNIQQLVKKSPIRILFKSFFRHSLYLKIDLRVLFYILRQINISTCDFVWLVQILPFESFVGGNRGQAEGWVCKSIDCFWLQRTHGSIFFSCPFLLSSLPTSL